MSLGPQIFPASGEDIDVLARTVFGEARGETLAGQIAVAWTIRHRAEIAAAFVRAHAGKWHPHYGDGSIAQVCKAHDQYTCWNADDPNRLRLTMVTLNDPSFQQCHHVATGVVNGRMEDTPPATTHYFNPNAGLKVPDWITGVPAHDGKPAIAPAEKAGTIGRHDFYRKVAA